MTTRFWILQLVIHVAGTRKFKIGCVFCFFLLFFLSGFSFTTIHESQDCKIRERALHSRLISQVIAAESSPLHIGSSRTQTGPFGFRAQFANH